MAQVELAQVVRAPAQANCGSCTACCAVIGIMELGKPYYARCSHDHGCCDIYGRHPVSCQRYRCAWHMGLLRQREDRRPDRIGILLQLEPEPNGLVFLEIYETRPDAAADWGEVAYLIQVVMSNKHVRRLPFAHAPVRFFGFGADVPVRYQLSVIYEHRQGGYDGTAFPMRLDRSRGISVWDGPTHPLLTPCSPPSASDPPG